MKKSPLTPYKSRFRFLIYLLKLGLLSISNISYLVLLTLLNDKDKRNQALSRYWITNFKNRYYNLSKKVYVLRDAFLPDLPTEVLSAFISYGCFLDVFAPYLLDKEFLDCHLPIELEGPYCVTFESDYGTMINKGDVVIDAGAWIGDFCAYASANGAEKVYAFEPIPYTYEILQKTALLNRNIIPLKLGLGNETKKHFFEVSTDSLSNKICEENTENSLVLDITTIDDFVKENAISQVDFIKSDIEGHERFMLMGAKETIKRFKPKLAICTYHYPEDPMLLEKIILDINPNYTIHHGRKKLYAYDKERGIK